MKNIRLRIEVISFLLTIAAMILTTGAAYFIARFLEVTR